MLNLTYPVLTSTQNALSLSNPLHIYEPMALPSISFSLVFILSTMLDNALTIMAHDWINQHSDAL